VTTQRQPADGSAPAGDVEFVVNAEAGILEAQALLLCESIRRFTGRYARSAITVVSPRADRRPSASSLRGFAALDAEFRALDVEVPCPDYGPSYKVIALADAERRPGPDIIVQIDADTLFVAEPDFSVSDHAIAARPVDVKGICTSGPDDPRDGFWRDLCVLCEVDYETIPLIETTVDRASVRASYNGGLVAARREIGFFDRTAELFMRLVAAGLTPRTIASGHREKSATGVVSADGSLFWGTSQAVLPMAARSLERSIGILPPTHNVPLHHWDNLVAPEYPVHLHYHWLCSGAEAESNPMLDGRMELRADVVAWLRSKVPLDQDPVRSR
jgi:hypothetical protein